MREMEKVLVLQILDSSWMEHLRAMDHLRSSIGLQGYAQIDPKVEYKREGMKIFAEMWNGVSDKVTDLVFRVEQFDPEFLSYLGARWQLDRAQTIHEAPAPEPSAAGPGGGGPRAAGRGHRREPAIAGEEAGAGPQRWQEKWAATTPVPADRVKSSKPAACARKPQSILSECRCRRSATSSGQSLRPGTEPNAMASPRRPWRRSRFLKGSREGYSRKSALPMREQTVTITAPDPVAGQTGRSRDVVTCRVIDVPGMRVA